MLISNHWLRYQIEQLLKFIGTLEDAQRAESWPSEVTEPIELVEPEPEPERFTPPDETLSGPKLVVVPGHFNLTKRENKLPQLPSGKYKRQRGVALIRDPATIDTLCYHQMAVAFGVSKSRVKWWANQAGSGKLPTELLIAYGLEDVNDPDALKAFAQRIALHERMCKVPYHIAGLLNGDVVHINPLLWYTYHGNGANARSLGVAADGHYPGLEKSRNSKHDDLNEFMIETMRGATRVAMVKAAANNIDIKYADAHRVYSGGRVGDPGEALWDQVVLWAVKEYGLKVRYERKRGSGRPIPQEWDPAALFNYKGKRVKALKEAA